MKTLRLPILTEWFEKILIGHKKDEYRQIKETIRRRLYHKDGTLKHWDAVEYTAGYGDHHPKVTLSLRGPISIGTGREDWGAEPGVAYYTIPLGSIISTRNLKPYQKGLLEMVAKEVKTPCVASNNQ